MLPFNVVEGKGFRKLMEVSDKRFKPFSRRTAKRKMADFVHKEALISLKKELVNAPDGCIHSTSDI